MNLAIILNCSNIGANHEQQYADHINNRKTNYKNLLFKNTNKN